jgi:N-glycosylase/DNA lyase
MFVKKHKVLNGEEVISVTELRCFSLADTFECGQAFRYELIKSEDNYVEYITIVGNTLLRVGQKADGELLFFNIDDEIFDQVCVPYFDLGTDYEKIKEDIVSHSNSTRLKEAADASCGIRILRQDPWEALFSFIISQNNNIPRIRKIIRKISAEYGKNLAQTLGKCPKDNTLTPCHGICSECGICYTFPTARAVLDNPDGLLPSKPGFRYKYLMDAAEMVTSEEVSLKKISEEGNAAFTLAELKKVKGVGDKVASCVALFGFGNLEAFPVDVWVRRAIDEYFDGDLDPTTLGNYAGVAQQYIFHYIRNLEKTHKNDNKD